ncbi:hypothetical protein QWA_10329 [Alcaligenes faecalis subsp. faecalis NCIB 8687]|uniref:hypothetical protein n=1 Tax=Alcaligenes faecalis TaxID=511 RepID=UPI000269EAC7|nr:hypothetical protein [Alcaligenes faecalis]EJC62457.1 hypothetical protein QWA_10329 [Alcaligenes faecalis subsp. faecalis NCIB 8687]RSE63653.1 hypothetical protein EGT81_04980 [Alcaligenes faecalis]
MDSWSQLFMNLARNLDHEEIDEFLMHLHSSTTRRLNKLDEENKNLTENEFEHPEDMHFYKDHLFDQAIATEAARNLGNQLSIVALYKKVELQTSRMIKELIPEAASKNLSYFNQLSNILPFDIKTLNGFSSFDELRLLNNSIKHGSIVSSELAKNYPDWRVKSEIEKIDGAYERLLPGVKQYVFDMGTRLYSNKNPSFSQS